MIKFGFSFLVEDKTRNKKFDAFPKFGNEYRSEICFIQGVTSNF